VAESTATKITKTGTIPIRCEGYIDENGKKQFAEGHEDIRLLAVPNPSVTRCEACQKMHAKIQHRSRGANRRKAQTVKRLKEQTTNAEKTLKDMGDDLTKEQKSNLEAVVKTSKAELAKMGTK